MKYFRIIAVLILFAGIQGIVFTEQSIFLKTGLGAGYDSNLLLSTPPYDAFLYLARFGGYGRWGGDGLQFTAHINSDAEMFDLFYEINAEGAAGITVMPAEETSIKAEAAYFIMTDIKQSAGGLLEFKQDIGENSTFKTWYDFEYSMGAPGVTNEDYISHGLSAGMDFDVNPSVIVGLELKDTYTAFSGLWTDQKRLNNNMIGGSLLLSLQPDYNWVLKIGGGYFYYDAFNSNQIITAGTNSLFLYNSAGLYKFTLSAAYDWSLNFRTEISADAGWAKLAYNSAYEENYQFKIKADYYFDASWKLEVPVYYTIKNTPFTGRIDRWRIESLFSYLF